ncbi:SDR family oxidoreductase [Paenarthrobacter sp. NPDC090522]|uniref:SDR family oxidoreductase n=1 Tax=Paenarthrobacter sp. NPDC090522 TaxID=3364383 RepID=UPI0037FB604F
MTIQRHALVFGGTGHIGRWLVLELLDQGVRVQVAVRSLSSFDSLLVWLQEHGAGHHPSCVVADFSAESLGRDPASSAFRGVTEVHNVAGAYAFGMTPDDAYQANVVSARKVTAFAGMLPSLERLVHLSGYRVGGQDPVNVPWSAERRAAEYRRLGAYEGSKVESDAVVQAAAIAAGVPLTMVNPASVIGDSRTGECGQVLGLGTPMLDLYRGRLPALPGGKRTFVPVVTADYLASFMALLPTVPAAEGKSYWVLDDATPSLPELLTMLGEHFGVRVPRLRVPVALLKKLPAKITRADPETLSFLSEERYPTAEATALAEAHGLHHPPVDVALKRWADYLVGRTATARVASM